MKRIRFIKGIVFIAMAFIISFIENLYGDDLRKQYSGGVNKKMIVAYLTSRSNMPDPNLVTHINYGHASFANPKEGTGGIIIPNKDFLERIVDLKKIKSDLKVLLMIGGWGTPFDGFSQMARNPEKRNSFVLDCVQIIKKYNIDGIDLDWEYPTSGSSGIAFSPTDRENFTTLVKQLKYALGPKKILSIASASDPQYIDFKNCIQFLDFVNVMTYDLGKPPYHNAALYSSKYAKSNAHDAIEMHHKAGVPYFKMNLGIPFYGHGDGKHIGSDVVYSEIPKLLTSREYHYNWDSEALVPYLTNSTGELIFSYDNAESIRYKVEYAVEKSLGGVMFWEYRHDDAENTLLNTINHYIKQ